MRRELLLIGEMIEAASQAQSLVAGIDLATLPAGLLSADARYVGFSSAATNLVTNDANNVSDAFVRDRGATDGFNLAPTLGPEPVPQSDEVGLEQFYPYAATDLGAGTAYVQLRTGNLVASFEDAVVPANGLSASVRHTYNSKRSGEHTGAGAGWTLSISDVDAAGEGRSPGPVGDVAGAVTGLNLSAPILTTSIGALTDGVFAPSGQLLELTDEDGTTHRFVRSGGPCGRWSSPPGVSLRIREVYGPAPLAGLPDAYELIRPDGVVYRAERISMGGVLPALEWRITKVTDRRGNQLTYGYDRFGPLAQTRVRTITHDRNPDSPLVRFDYTLLGDLDRIVTLPGVAAPDPATGANRSFERIVDYDIDPVTKQLRSVTDNAHAPPPGAVPATRTNAFSYAPATNVLTAVSDGRNNTTGFTTVSGAVSAIKDRRGKNWTYASSVDGSGHTTTTATSPVGAATTYKISPRGPMGPGDNRIAGGNVVSVADAGHGEPPTPVTTTYGWTANRLTSSTDGAGATTSREYDDLGQVTKVTEPAPNAAVRSDVAEAVATAVTSTLSYRYLAGLGDPACAPPPSSGPVTTAGYCSAVGELERATYADNHPAQRRITDFSHDGAGNVTRASERASPDPALAPSTPPSATDRSTAFTYYARGGLHSIDGPRTDVADVTTWGDTADATYGGYDRTGQPTRITDALNKVKTFAYTPYGARAKVTDRDGRSSTAKYDERDNVVEASDPAGHTRAFRYDANDNRTHDTSPRGVATAAADDYTAISTYDANDWPIQASSPGPTSTSPRTVVNTAYADDGRKASETSARGSTAAHTTTYSYWPNRMLKTADAPGEGATRAVTDASYDGAGRVARILGPMATAGGARPETKITYNPDASVAKTEATSPASSMAVTRLAYNAHGEAVRTDGPRSVNGVEAATTATYDTFGQPTRTRRRADANRWVDSATSYDLAGNPKSVTQPTGSGGQLTTTYSFDAADRLASQDADPVNPGHTVAFEYTGEGLQAKRTDRAGGALARVVTSAYNPDDTVQSTLASDYDPAAGAAKSTLATCNFAAGAAPTSGYDADRNLVEARTVSLTGAPAASAAATCDGGTLERSQSFSYNEAGLMTSAAQGVRSPETNALVTRNQTFAHDPDGQVASATHAEPGGASLATRYSYTEAGWAKGVTDWRDKQTTTSYLASGTPSSQTMGSGVASGSFDWHPDGSPKALTWKKGSAGAVVRSHTNLAYDAGAQRRSEDVAVLQPGALTTSGGKAAYDYDLLDRLTSWTSPHLDTDAADRLRTTFGLDDAGNMTSETATRVTTGTTHSSATATYPNGRLATRRTEAGLGGSTVTDHAFSYDGVGQETSRSTNGAPTTASAYDPAGRTKAVDDLKAANADVAYVYDSNDRLISRHEPNAPPERAKATLYFHWQGGAALNEETDGAGRSLVRYLTDPLNRSLAQQGFRVSSGRADPADTNGTWKWLLPDPDGNVATHLLDNQAVAEQGAWDPYGRPQKAGSSQPDPTKKGSSLGFQGALTDRVNGSVVLGPRQYDPTTARFVTPDTFVAGDLDLELGLDALTGNRYLFAGANPTMFYEDGHGWGWCKKFWDCDDKKKEEGKKKEEDRKGNEESPPPRPSAPDGGPGNFVGGPRPAPGSSAPAKIGRAGPYGAAAAIGWKAGRELREHRNKQGAFRRQLGGRKGDGCDAHHIVAVKDRRAIRSRRILKRADIDVNDPRNGVLIAREGHQSLHTDDYHRDVEARLSADPNTDYQLASLGADIQSRYPCHG
ncbi:MAG: AHH domain-containing protein [Actinomycetota bacterium]|nr:AHH domain-containing protein [Actinomycetota bacterium]